MADDRNQIPALIAALDQRDKPKIRAAVDALIPLAAQSPELRSELESLLKYAESEGRWPVAYILGQLPKPSGATVRALLDGLDHREPDIRWAIALLLIRISREQTELVELLIELSARGTVNQKRMAIYCLRDLHLQDGESLGVMMRSLHDSDPTVRVAAVTSLRFRPELSVSGREEMLQCFLHDEDLRVRNAAGITLAQLGAPSQALIEALRQAAAGENPQLKKTAKAALSILETGGLAN